MVHEWQAKARADARRPRRAVRPVASLWDVVESRTDRTYDGPFRTRDAAHAVAMEATRAARERGSPLSYWARVRS